VILHRAFPAFFRAACATPPANPPLALPYGNLTQPAARNLPGDLRAGFLADAKKIPNRLFPSSTREKSFTKGLLESRQHRRCARRLARDLLPTSGVPGFGGDISTPITPRRPSRTAPATTTSIWRSSRDQLRQRRWPRSPPPLRSRLLGCITPTTTSVGPNGPPSPAIGWVPAPSPEWFDETLGCSRCDGSEPKLAAAAAMPLPCLPPTLRDYPNQHLAVPLATTPSPPPPPPPVPQPMPRHQVASIAPLLARRRW